jgi:hypothetical protein
MCIPCCGNPSLPLKIFQKPSKTSTKLEQYMYIMHLVILHYYNVTWLSIPLWIYQKTWTPFRFLQHGEYLPQIISSHRDRIQQRLKHYSWKDNHLTTRRHSGSSTTWMAWSYFRRYTRSLDILELSVLIVFSFLITIGEVCMLKSETSLLGVNNVIKWELFYPLDNSRFLHSLFKACSIASHVI